MDEGTSCIDRISELPDFILHHILSYLNTKEAARTCVISKRWQYVWETFPILDCCQGYFRSDLEILNQKFMSYVDKKLLRFRENNLTVKKFSLFIARISNDLAPRVCTWLELVADMGVQELDLCISEGKPEKELHQDQDMSMILSTMESLTALNLSCSVVFSSTLLDRNAAKLCSLVEVRLEGVFIDEATIQDLVSSCHLMKGLSLICCLGFKNLEICDHNKLEKVVYHSHVDFKLEKLIIKVPTLEKLEISSAYKDKMTTCEIICENLKSLSLSGITIGSKWLQSMITPLPLLEHLYLSRCSLPKAMKLSSQALKEISIINCTELMDAEFDTPNVRSLKYSGKTMPCLYSTRVADYQTAEAELFVHPENMDGVFFTALYNFLRDNRFQDLSFNMNSASKLTGEVISFNVMDYIGIQLPPFELNIMKLGTYTLSSVNFGALFDGLFWNLRPRILCFQLNLQSSNFVKELLHSLVNTDVLNCYRAKKIECWCLSLKDIRLINDNAKGLKINTVLNVISLNKFTKFVDDWVIEAKKKPCVQPEVEVLSFQMSWWC